MPRAYQWADGSAYVNHVALVRQARGREMPDSFWNDPLMYQGGSDGFLGPRDDIPLADEAWGCDFEAEVVVVTGDVPQGDRAEAARELIRLVGLTNDVSLAQPHPGELAKGFGFFQSKPASAFSPVFVTPDALGDAWRDGKLHGALRSRPERQAVRPRRRRRGHDLRLRDPDRPRRARPARSAPGRSSARAPSPTATPTAGRAGRSPKAASAIAASPK